MSEGLEIFYWPFEEIDQSVFDIILNNQLYEMSYVDKNAGGIGLSAMEYADTQFSIFSHIWIAKLDGQWVGTSLIKHTGDAIVNVYVKPEYRRRHIGSVLLERAIRTGETFGSIHTEDGRWLYENYGIPCYRTNPPWALPEDETKPKFVVPECFRT